MGYLCTIMPESPELREKMLSFMDENLIPAHEVFDSVDIDHDVTEDGVLTDWAYGTDNGEIGFYYHAGAQDLCRKYSNMVLRWMAMKVGKRKVWDEHGISDPIPYTITEGSETRPLYERSKYEDKLEDALDNDHFLDWQLCDDLGYHAAYNFFLMDEGHLEFDDPRNGEFNEAIRSEIERLEDLWKKSF